MKTFYKILGAIAIIITILTVQNAYAQTTWTVYNIPSMKLKVRITSAQTVGIKLTPPKRNGVNETFPATGGGIIELKQGTRTEHIYFPIATVDADKVITLTGSVIRDIQWNDATSFASGGNGQIFTPGAQVKFVNDARLFNFTAYLDKVNTFTGSGQLTSNQTNQAWIDANCVTTVQRDAFSFVNEGNIVCNSTTSTIDTFLGGAWLQLATTTGSILNATEAIAGKVLLTGTGGIVTSSGSTAPGNVLWTNYVTGSGGTSKHGYIPFLGTSGFLDLAVGGTGVDSNTQSGVLIGNGTNPVTSIAPGTDGNVLISNGDEWTSGTAGAGKKIRLFVGNGIEPLTSNVLTIETGGADARFPVTRFDTTTAELAHATFVLPDDYTSGATFTIQAIWAVDAGDATGVNSQTVVWGFQGSAYTDGETFNTTFSNQVTSTDTRLDQTDIMISPATAALTIAGSPAAGELVDIEIERLTGSDDLGIDARLIGIIITYT